ncbi:MAG: HepT-like ribonuclease domain-containing protein [Campylobacterota bacterium]|nr:HepT-like ribonuclease domain-containing protein [Campylobacterota bacterium]
MKSLEDEKTTRPAIMMHLTSIAEQFSKIKDKKLLSNFNDEDVKGAIDTRNFIAHDYEGVNLPIIEFIIRERLPILKVEIIELLK